MHLNAISNGQGAPSTMLLILAGESEESPCKATLSITADTGWENDMLWSTGERTTAREYFERVTQPLAREYEIEAVFVRPRDKNSQPRPPIPEIQAPNHIDIPLFGSQGGRMMQTCTSKWKIAAIRQELRRRGASTATTYLGLTMSEVHRMKPTDREWNQHAYPLIERHIYRVTCQAELERMGIPYLVTTECDGCPHKDPARWQRTSPATIKQLATFEARFKGEFYLTRTLIPLEEAIEKMDTGQLELFDNCDGGGYCFT